MILKSRLHDTRGARCGFDDRLDVLKTRPLEIVLCFLAGDTDRQVAEQLGISVRSVRRYVRGLMAYFDCASRAELRSKFQSDATPSNHRSDRVFGTGPVHHWA